jgi:flavin reductase (DIM6/NTAB) family NADH-FMN oxidoreductase RutF
VRIDPAGLDRRGNYQLLISAIVPRPVAWVTSQSREGVANLAPFSFFQGVGSNPPTLMLAFGRRRGGSPKDTPRNILETGEFVVNLAGADQVALVEASAADLPPEVSEAEHLGLELLPGEKVAAPRLAASTVSLECRLVEHLEIAGSTVLFGEVVLYHLADEVLDEDGRVDPGKLRPLARLGGPSFASLGEIFTASPDGGQG